jgi:hypothetical protein
MMPSWQLHLTERATEDLAAVWLASSQRVAVNSATDTMERLLTGDPRGAGEQLSEGLWAISCPPLRALYEIDDERREVNVQTIKELPY